MINNEFDDFNDVWSLKGNFLKYNNFDDFNLDYYGY